MFYRIRLGNSYFSNTSLNWTDYSNAKIFGKESSAQSVIDYWRKENVVLSGRRCNEAFIVEEKLNKNVFEGGLFIFSEQGVGPAWSLQENWQQKPWSYDNLKIIESGDILAVSRDNFATICWMGFIDMEIDEKQQIYYPKNVDKKLWKSFFNEDRPYTGRLFR